jgi:hypothetical protein
VFVWKAERRCANQNVCSTPPNIGETPQNGGVFASGFKKVKYFGRLRVLYS